MGGSGSPAPSTTRPGAAAAVAILPDLPRSGIAKSGLVNSDFGGSDLADPLADPFAGPCADALGTDDFGDPVEELGRKAALVDASGGCCGGNPAAIRGRAELAASGRSAPAEGFPGTEPTEACGGLPVVTAALLARGALGVEPVVEAAVSRRRRAASRPLPSGGALPEFTAYPPC
jgi:hypothetical protein